MRPRTRYTVLAVAAPLALVMLTAGSCGGSDTKSPGQQIAKDRQNVQLKNDVEGKNYNRRLALADNPASLIWCTVYTTSPSAKAFTVPIVGKLTSSSKRPTPTEQAVISTGNETYNPELPGPDGMYGSSVPYQYGFDPAGNYHEFSASMQTYCTSVPTVIQKETTQISIGSTTDTGALDEQVQKALAACQKSNTDQSAACPAAAKLLGIGSGS